MCLRTFLSPLLHGATGHPVSAVILLVEAANDDAARGAGVGEESVLEVDAYVRDTSVFASPCTVVEEDEIALTQSMAADASAVLRQHVGRGAFEHLAVYLTIDSGDESRTVCAYAADTFAHAVRCAEPLRYDAIECGVVCICHFDAECGGGVLHTYRCGGMSVCGAGEEHEAREKAQYDQTKGRWRYGGIVHSL